MKKTFLSCVAIFLTILPVIIALAWHINNQGWPNDDAANYMVTAYQQYLSFQEGSLLDGFKALYQIRGWRPTLFPVLATPFLLLFKGNVLAATGATLVLCFLVCQIYIYAIARRYLDSLRASLVAVFVGSFPVIARFSTVFFSEIAWLAFFTGFVFHLLKSENFRKPLQATIAGIFLGLAALIRPAETCAITILPLTGIITIALFKKFFTLNSAVRVIVFVILSTCLLIVSALIKQVDYRLVLSIGIIIVLLQLIIKTNKEQEPGFLGFNFFAVSFVIINLLWWADIMPHLYLWIYNASFGLLGKITDAPFNLKQIFFIYLFPQATILAAISLILLWPNTRKESFCEKRLYVLAMITLGMLLPMFFMYAITGTGDARRIFVGMSFLLMLLAILSLQDGSIGRVRDVVLALIVVIQLAGFFYIAKGELPSSGHSLLIRSLAEQMPKRKADKNESVILRLLELGVPRSSAVGVYTIALFQPRDRIYEPSAMQLAALTTGSDINIIYYWDICDYYTVIKRLRENRVQFLLIDTYKDPENRSKHQPSTQFTTALLEKMESSDADPPGLRRITSFILDGREHVLFEVKKL
ncbi:MAG: hypothetical protein NTW65_01790 [Deltaproteobacteria bacterium]|nr:hypothetical protein [Deltaproteobacteria bacterium]